MFFSLPVLTNKPPETRRMT